MDRGERAAPATLRDVMSTKVIVVTPEMTVRGVAARLSEAHINGAPVVAGARVVGVVSTADLLDFAGESRAVSSDTKPDGAAWPGSTRPPPEFFVRYWADRAVDLDEWLERGEAAGILDGFTAADAMSRRLHALPPYTGLSEAADYMLRHEIHRVLVMDGERLLGVVTTTDMVRAIGGGGPRPG